MLELKYIEVSPNGNSYCSFPYYCTTNTSIVFKNLYVPLQPSITGGINIFAEGPGRFQSTGNGLDGSAPKENDQYFRAVFGYYRSAVVPQTIYYDMEWNTPDGIVGDLEMGNAYLKLNNTIVATGTTYTGDTITLTQPFYLFNHFNPNWRNNYIRSGYCGEVLFYENGVLAAKYTPYLDDNGVAGFFDENNQTMIYSMGNPWVAGPPASSINISPENKSIAADGGSIVVNVASENDWVANPTDGSWYSISPTGGTSADTAVTITVPSYTGTTARQDTISFVDTTTSDEAVFTLKQRKYSTGQPMYLGAYEISEIFLGEDEISEAYLGDVLVYSSGPFMGLSVYPNTVSFNNGSLTADIKVKSSEAWTMTLPSWVSASQTTGDTGETIVTLTATAQAAATADTISITTANFSASVSVNYVVFEQVSYVYATTHNAYVQANHINTGIEHTASTMTIEIEYYGLDGNSDRMVGYQQGDDICPNDASDFRVFGFVGGTFDYQYYRNSFGNSSSGYHHFTIGDCFCYDNETGQYLCQDATKGIIPTPNCHILVDVSLIKVKSVKIMDGSTVLFNGVAAKIGNNIGLYDLVSSQLFYNSNVPMSYDT